MDVSKGIEGSRGVRVGVLGCQWYKDPGNVTGVTGLGCAVWGYQECGVKG